MVRHIVLIKVREDVVAEQIQGVFSKLEALKSKIPGITNYTDGPNCSPEGLNRGYTHGFIMDFIDEACRDAYLPHPEHQAVIPELIRILTDDEDKVLVIDIPV